ncbi:MAG: S8 family serine peptidase [Thermoanaerobaculia bacterium]
MDVEIAEGRDVLDAVAAFAARPEIAVAEANTFGAYALIPNDTLYGSEWHLPQMQVDDAWDVTTGSTQIVVAVLDSGTEFTHEDLGLGVDGYRNVWLNPGEDAWSDPTNPATGNGVDDDGNGFIDDWQGWDFNNGNNDPAGTFFHGTAVAGVISAKTNNNRGVAGVAGGNGAPGVKVLLAGVGDSAPNGAILDDAILYAADSGARIIQLSLTVGQSSAIDAALAMAYDTFGLTIICSSGNGGTSSVGYPSSDSHVMAIGSTGMTDQKSSFSQYGVLLELAAPGEGIWMLDLNDGYGPSSGTSFSSPNTSGTAALVLSLAPTMTNAQLRQLLHDTAAKVGGYNYNWNPGMPGHSMELGYGRVDALAAVQAVQAPIFEDGFESGDTSAWTTSAP